MNDIERTDRDQKLALAYVGLPVTAVIVLLVTGHII
jgi:hypothetical protein